MAIEWNKVTWYSKLLAVILALAIFALGFYLGSQAAEVNPPPQVLKASARHLSAAAAAAGHGRLYQIQRLDASALKIVYTYNNEVLSYYPGKVKENDAGVY